MLHYKVSSGQTMLAIKFNPNFWNVAKNNEGVEIYAEERRHFLQCQCGSAYRNIGDERYVLHARSNQSYCANAHCRGGPPQTDSRKRHSSNGLGLLFRSTLKFFDGVIVKETGVRAFTFVLESLAAPTHAMKEIVLDREF